MARWCEKHRRWECTKPRSRGRGPCHAQAVKGTDACTKHCGKTLAQARRDAVTAWAATAGDDGITPRAAVAGMLGLAWRRAELLGEALRQQVENDAGAGDAAAGGLVGYRYSASEAAGGIYATGEQARALAELERAERELVVKFAEAGHRMGIEEARVALAQQLGGVLSQAIAGTLTRLGLNVGDPVLRAAVAAELHQITARGGGDG